MRLRTYRLTVIGTILASFFVGLHMPALHEIIEHGATARWDIVGATALLAVATVAGGWMLLRAGGPLSREK
jgi:predicted Kef-type K+ transport protein